MENIHWKHPNTITGPPAEGSRFFRRQYINDELWREIEKGVHVLFSAPRRVGKTSIMIDIVNQKRKGYTCVFENIQSVNRKDDFYKRLYFLLLNQLGKIERVKKILVKWLKAKGIEEISREGGIKIKEIKSDYKTELLSLIAKLPELEEKVVLFLDEFSEVIYRIRKYENIENAIDILQTLREIRQKKEFRHCFFVLSGSVGLEHVVESIDRLTLINDLHPLKVGPLSLPEAEELIRQLTDGSTMIIKEAEAAYLLEKLGHMIPFFIQLLIEECNDTLYSENRPGLTNSDIDSALEQIINKEKNLNDWEDRLRPDYLSQSAFEFCRDILTRIAHAGYITTQEIFDLSVKYAERDKYMNHLKMLVNDGYLSECHQSQYRFVSPLLKSWWMMRHPEFEIEK
ncbi:MAG: hypothetical protein JXA03_14475 [Bacteroidales bacterium]|nr:hypothetical protein [Bacteroidales bacterium]